VTHVGVSPTHTRRGVATALMARQIRDLQSRGEIVATLRASGARIYGHWGFGVASQLATFDLTKTGARLRPGVVASGPARLVDWPEAWAILPRIQRVHGMGREGDVERYSRRTLNRTSQGYPPPISAGRAGANWPRPAG
jgi:hypothetical protein